MGRISSVVRRVAVTVILSLPGLSPLAHGAIDTYTFTDSELQNRYYQLGRELRCPKCDGQSIGDSNAPIANDLRAVIYEQLQGGMSDTDIVNFMVQRYGEFVLYRPKMSGKTLALWLTPFFFVVLGAISLVVIVRGRRQRAAEKYDELTPEEQERLQQILARSNQS